MKKTLAPWTNRARARSARFFKNMMRAVRAKQYRRSRYWSSCLSMLFVRHGIPLAPDPKWVCAQPDGTFDHDWKWVHDCAGDADVINGVQHFAYRECRACGAQDHETPFEHEPLDDDVM